MASVMISAQSPYSMAIAGCYRTCLSKRQIVLLISLQGDLSSRNASSDMVPWTVSQRPVFLCLSSTTVSSAVSFPCTDHPVSGYLSLSLHPGTGFGLRLPFCQKSFYIRRMSFPPASLSTGIRICWLIASTVFYRKGQFFLRSLSGGCFLHTLYTGIPVCHGSYPSGWFLQYFSCIPDILVCSSVPPSFFLSGLLTFPRISLNDLLNKTAVGSFDNEQYKMPSLGQDCSMIWSGFPPRLP